MDALDVIDTLEDMIEDGNKSFFSDKVAIEKEEALRLIRELRIGLPDNLKQAEWITNERQRIIDEANKEADELVERARQEAIKMIDADNITQMAKEKAQTIIEKALEDGDNLRNGSINYAQDILINLNKDIEKVSRRIQSNYRELDSLKTETKIHIER